MLREEERLNNQDTSIKPKSVKTDNYLAFIMIIIGSIFPIMAVASQIWLENDFVVSSTTNVVMFWILIISSYVYCFYQAYQKAKDKADLWIGFGIYSFVLNGAIVALVYVIIIGLVFAIAAFFIFFSPFAEPKK